VSTRGLRPWPGGLRTLSSARWPEHSGDVVAPLPGFIVSSFNPLVAQVAERCLTRHYGPLTAGDPVRARRTALLLASSGWDLATAAELAKAVESGRRVQPLLFFQSNPNAILGHVAARWGLTGPMVCSGPPPSGVGLGLWADSMQSAGLAPHIESATPPEPDPTINPDPTVNPAHTGHPDPIDSDPIDSDPAAADRLLADALWQAALVIEDGDADEALVIVAEQGATAGESDSAIAVLVAPREHYRVEQLVP
jgi:hypothetical protein